MTQRTNFKPERIVDKVRRHLQRRQTVDAEQLIMRAVRRADRYCRFPLCGCGRLKLSLEVAHAGEQGHRGMGGNRSGSATTPENLILLCRPRHRAHKFSVDKKTLCIEAMTDQGLRGPVQWLIDVAVVESLESPSAWAPHWAELAHERDGRHWYRLARETAPHHCEPLTEAQAAVLKMLAGMEC